MSGVNKILRLFRIKRKPTYDGINFKFTLTPENMEDMNTRLEALLEQAKQIAADMEKYGATLNSKSTDILFFALDSAYGAGWAAAAEFLKELKERSAKMKETKCQESTK